MRAALATTACLLVLAALPAGAAPTPDQLAAVKARHDSMEALGKAMKVINGYVKDGKGSQADVAAAAAVLDNGAQKMANWWPAGTAIGVGKSEAKPAIWADMAKFNTYIDKYKAATPALVAAAATGDKAAIGKAFGGVGGTCKSCHDAYREED